MQICKYIFANDPFQAKDFHIDVKFNKIQIILVRSLEGDKKFAYSKLTDGPECDVYEKQNFKMSDDWFVGYSKKKNICFIIKICFYFAKQ